MRWQFRTAPIPFQEDDVARLAAEAEVSPVLARLLLLRGIRGAEAARLYLHPAIEQLHSPLLMLGMAAAVERLAAAIERQERVLIYGDYDVDGTTAIVVLKTAIELCGGTAEFHVPHRIRDGYGMKDEVIEQAAADGIRLVISVDTGIRAFHAAETARRVGLDLIVTDHHLPESNEGVPQALAVLNPNQAGCGYPCKELCGAGVAFKLTQALLERVRGAAECARLLPSFLKMVAIATIADAVPLTGENRVIAALGLEGLRRPVNGGLKLLMQVAGVDVGRQLKAGDVAFKLAPRINAAGRMDVACEVIELFTSKDVARQTELAEKLNRLNGDRQAEEQRILEAALGRAAELRDAYCLVVDGDGWHRGVIGIVATRVVERTGKPVLVVSRDGAEAHGSGRSIPEFHLLDALESCRELFTRFGGHAHAVGFALPSERVAQLAAALDAHARTKLTPEMFEPLLPVDGELALEEITPQLFDEVCRLEPFGVGNREPVFVARAVRLVGPPKVLKEKHAKLKVVGASGKRPLDVLAWRKAEQVGALGLLAGDCVDVAFTLDENEHPDFGGLQLQMCDVRVVGKAVGARYQ